MDLKHKSSNLNAAHAKLANIVLFIVTFRTQFLSQTHIFKSLYFCSLIVFWTVDFRRHILGDRHTELEGVGGGSMWVWVTKIGVEYVSMGYKGRGGGEYVSMGYKGRGGVCEYVFKM